MNNSTRSWKNGCVQFLSVNNSRNSEEVLWNDKRTLVGIVDLRARDSQSGAPVCCPSHHAPQNLGKLHIKLRGSIFFILFILSTNPKRLYMFSRRHISKSAITPKREVHALNIKHESIVEESSCRSEKCMTYTIAVCTMKNSRWWTEELSETCRVLFQKLIWGIRAFRCFYYKNFLGLLERGGSW